MKPLTISATNIDRVFATMKRQIERHSPLPQPGFVLPMSINTGEIDRTKYKGRGRPRREDYIYVETLSLLKGADIINPAE